MMVAEWFLYFIAYSVLGYILEIVFCAIWDKKFQNRGFLFGPVCPIYGYGALLVLLSYHLLQWPWWGMFFAGMILCVTLEYLTSYWMEKLFHVRWWDYSKATPLNINGRVALEPAVLFGVGGLLIIYLVQPGLEFLVMSLPKILVLVLAGVLFTIFIIDTVMSTLAAIAIKGEIIKGVKIELTPEIKKFARDYYRKHKRVERKVARKTKRATKKAQRRVAKTKRD